MRKTKKLALASLCAALGTVFVSFGALLNVFDMSAALLASLVVLFCLMEMGFRWSIGVYAVISILSLILMPGASAAWTFLLLFGYMPISKFGFERFCKKAVWVAWIPKLALFNTLYAVMVFLLGELLGFTAENAFGIPPVAVYIAFFVLGNLLYIVCDIFYGRLARIYIVKFRHRFSKYLK